MNERFVALTITCGFALASGVGLVMARRLVRCAGLLLVHSLAIAATYLLLSAELLAMGQVIVYTGAIVVLFLFVVLLLPDGGLEPRLSKGRGAIACLAGLCIFAALGAAVAGVVNTGQPTAPATADLSTTAVARALFGPHLVPFELTALLLLIAIIGAVALWHRQEEEGRQ